MTHDYKRYGILDDFVDRHNENPKPFIWTAKANDILAKVMRAKDTFITVALCEARRVPGPTPPTARLSEAFGRYSR